MCNLLGHDDNIESSESLYYVPGPLLSALHVLTRLILTTTLLGGCYYNPRVRVRTLTHLAQG